MHDGSMHAAPLSLKIITYILAALIKFLPPKWFITKSLVTRFWIPALKLQFKGIEFKFKGVDLLPVAREEEVDVQSSSLPYD